MNLKSLDGGIGIFYLNLVKMVLLEKSINEVWEFCVTKVTLEKVDMCIVIKYRCPKASFSFFLDEYVILVSHYLLQFELCLIIGDFDVHMNKTNHKSVALLSSMEEMYFYKRYSVPTHVMANGIDLAFSNHNACTFAQVEKSLTSDHFCATFKINLSLTIEPLCIKQRRQKWMWDRSEYHSIFDLIIFDTNK